MIYTRFIKINRREIVKETKTPYQILSTKEEKKEIKKLIHDNKPYGWTNAEFLISLLKSIEDFYNVKRD